MANLPKEKRTSHARIEKREQVYLTFNIIFCCSLVVSNILAYKVLDFGWLVLPGSIVLFPIVYVVNDVVSDVFGFKRMRRTIMYGFLAAAGMSAFTSLVAALPGSDPVASDAFASVFSTTWRILAASFVSYLTGSMLNSLVMTRLKRRFERNLFFRCVLSTAVGEAADAALFLTIAFAGTMSNEELLVMIASQWVCKVLYEVIVYPATRVTLKKTRAMCDVD